jgi:cytochrome c2
MVEEVAATEDEAPAADGPDPELVAAGETVFRAMRRLPRDRRGRAQSRGSRAERHGTANVVAHVEGFRYSPALREAGESGMVWNEENLAGYLADPRGFIRGNRMAFQGLRSDEDIAAVIAYMQVTGAAE